jgi:hypothetical protein
MIGFRPLLFVNSQVSINLILPLSLGEEEGGEVPKNINAFEPFPPTF